MELQVLMTADDFKCRCKSRFIGTWRSFRYVAMTALVGLLLPSCETDITLDLPPQEEKLVVEGHIETGTFPYVVLTKNFSLFTGVDPEQVQNLFVHDAAVIVSDGQNDFELTEFCISTLSEPLKTMVLDYLGINEEDLAGQDFCAYVTLSLTGEEGKVYRLTVQTADHHLQALTAVPHNVKIDSLWSIPANVMPDSLRVLWMQFREPDTFGNYYRYWTKANNEPFYPGYFGSVLDDQFFNGEIFSFNLDRGYPGNASIDFETYGLFGVGDTIIVKIAMIDKAHYDFWRTVEQQYLSGGGPFSTPTYIRSNVNGGLGIWGGYGAVYDTVVLK